MHPDNPNQPPKDGLGFQILGEISRVEQRMVKDGQAITPDLDAAIIARLQAWRKEHPNARDPRKLCSLSEVAARIPGNIGQATLSEVIKGTYKGDQSAQLVKIAAFLDDEEQRASRVEFARNARITLFRKLWGVFESTKKYNRLAGIVGQSGWGKTNVALAYERDNPGTVYFRLLKPESNDHDVSHLICATIPGLHGYQGRTHRQRVNHIIEYIRQHRGAVWICDEAQMLGKAGWEMFRTFHDVADPSQQRGLPIIFLGDENFERLIVTSKAGAKTAVAPQLARRMLFVFNIDKQGCDDDGGDVVSVEDILKIVHSGRIRVVTSDAARWLTRLANTPAGGHIGQIIDTLRVAIDLSEKSGASIVDVKHLQAAFEMNNGRELALAIDANAGGELLKRASA